MSLILVQFSMIWPSWQASLSREGLRSGKSDSLSYPPPLSSSDTHKASHARRACLLMGRCRFIVDSLLIRTSTVSQFRQPCSRRIYIFYRGLKLKSVVAKAMVVFFGFSPFAILCSIVPTLFRWHSPIRLPLWFVPVTDALSENAVGLSGEI